MEIRARMTKNHLKKDVPISDGEYLLNTSVLPNRTEKTLTNINLSQEGKRALLDEDYVLTEDLKYQKYQCTKCDFLGTTESDFNSHFTHVHLHCHSRNCNYKAQTKFMLQKHIECVHLSLKRFGCGYCDYETKLIDELRQHVNDRHKKKITCEMCDFFCIKKSAMDKHLKSRHKKLKIKKKSLNQCELCNNYSSVWRSSLKAHIESIHTQREFACNLCSFMTMVKKKFASHMQCYHKCVDKFRVRKRNTFKSHMENLHTNDKCKYYCSICSIIRSSKIYRTGKGLKKHCCGYCAFKCANINQMKEHLRILHNTDITYKMFNSFDQENKNVDDMETPAQKKKQFIKVGGTNKENNLVFLINTAVLNTSPENIMNSVLSTSSQQSRNTPQKYDSNLFTDGTTEPADFPRLDHANPTSSIAKHASMNWQKDDNKTAESSVSISCVDTPKLDDKSSVLSFVDPPSLLSTPKLEDEMSAIISTIVKTEGMHGEIFRTTIKLEKLDDKLQLSCIDMEANSPKLEFEEIKESLL